MLGGARSAAYLRPGGCAADGAGRDRARSLNVATRLDAGDAAGADGVRAPADGTAVAGPARHTEQGFSSSGYRAGRDVSAGEEPANGA